MDFVSDSLANGRRIKLLTVADDFSHECVDIAVDWGISGQYVTQLLDHAGGYPLAVRTDNGQEFTSPAFMAWAQSHGVRHILIEPGRPMKLDPLQTLRRSIKLATPDFLNSVGAPVGAGRSNPAVEWNARKQSPARSTPRTLEVWR